MMYAWSHSPRFQHLALFYLAYVLGCGFAQALAIVPGITVSIWPPGGVFIATLILTSPYSWPWWILIGCLAEMTAQLVWFHSPLLAGLLIYLGNALCAVVGATLLNRAIGRPVRLETLREVLAFVVLGAGVAPLASATVGSAALAWFGVKSQTFTSVWPLFWIGDATGILLVAPPALVAIQHWRNRTQISAMQWTEAGVLGLIFLGVAALALKYDFLLSAYIIMPPILWAAVRFEFKGVAVALCLLALTTMALTLSGSSQFIGDPETQRQKQVMLQLFLAISAFSALIVAAISRQHQQALLSLQQSERSLRDLVETLPVMIDCAAPDGEPVYRSRQLREFLGYELEELDGVGKSRLAGTIDTSVHPDDVAGVKENLARSLATGEPFARMLRLQRFDGEYRWVDTRAVPMRNAEGAIVQWNITCLDIDGEVRAQQKLRLAQERLGRASQLASLAELSASIAHEVNQPLAAIVANSLACNRWLSTDPPNLGRAKLTAERIIRDANSAADVVSRIRALFKQSTEAKSSTALGSAIAEALALVAEEMEQRRIRIDTDVEGDLPPVSLDRVQVQQVLINLIRNGMEAMDTTTEDRVLGIRARRLGDVVQTEISDHGPGVAVSGRIFEPFFTTKGNGMGMGLTICRSIVESRGGRLWAEKNKKHGALFIFTLPVELKAAP
ncbi:MASE1 domain-containing protein [Bosea sp. Tri-44]|uniref:MASE1 domain-containing protein n=1 Tax=Bosea sp. Tri-44 TaxID=1972137 RepID=UPI00100F08FF|nr:MASE1 domain-containing protein [Bosea sp. Tri-44]